VYLGPAKRQVVGLLASMRPLRYAGDVFIRSSAYLAVK
jgi:hypothetical protein